MVTKSEMLKLLQATEFPKNTGRTNVLKKGQTYSHSMVLGKVRKLYSSCNGKICLVNSRHNEKNKGLLLVSKSLLRAHAPAYRAQAVTFNTPEILGSIPSTKHMDLSFVSIKAFVF